jgi:hypothetical protein
MRIEITSKHYRRGLGFLLVFLLVSLYLTLPFAATEKFNFAEAFCLGMKITLSFLCLLAAGYLVAAALTWCFKDN